jgi:hypothetical protein
MFKKHPPRNDLVTSELYNEKTFYKRFISDLQECHSEVIIESPYYQKSVGAWREIYF